MNIQKHTPTPWNVATSIKEFVPKEQGGGLKVRLMADSVRVGTLNSKEDPELAKANAVFIVKCVNSHETLLAGLKQLQGWLKDKYTIERDGNARSGFAHYVEFCDELIEKAEGK